MMRFAALALLAAMAAAGCSSYSWKPSVPESMRTVSVPTMRNESDVTELGAVMSRQLLREFQREGTFSVRAVGDAALEIQGIVKKSSAASRGYDRRSGLKMASYEMSAEVEISVIDKRNGKVLVNNRIYVPTTSYTSGQDRTTAMRDASGRLADDLARRVVDDVVNLKW